ncbi:MAG: sugar phosphate isomerase/epimerase family protein, partial [Planctomycetota bacterium]
MSTTRRRFLSATAASALTATLAAPLRAMSSATGTASPYMKTIGLQLWTVRNQMAADRDATLQAIVDAGYKQVEMGVITDGGVELAKAARDLGLRVTSSFCDWNVFANPEKKGVASPQKVIDAAQKIGLDHIVFGYIGKGFRETPDQYKAIADRCNAAAEKARRAGIRLCYHNHSFEFKPFNNAVKQTSGPASGNEMPTGFDVLMKRFDPEMEFELDVFWAAVGGWDPVQTMQRLDGRVSQVHLKDLKRETPVLHDEGKVPAEAFQECGDGMLDMPKILEISRKIGVSQCHVEQDQSP